MHLITEGEREGTQQEPERGEREAEVGERGDEARPGQRGLLRLRRSNQRRVAGQGGALQGF